MYKLYPPTTLTKHNVLHDNKIQLVKDKDEIKSISKVNEYLRKD